MPFLFSLLYDRLLSFRIVLLATAGHIGLVEKVGEQRQIAHLHQQTEPERMGGDMTGLTGEHPIAHMEQDQMGDDELSDLHQRDRLGNRGRDSDTE